MKKVAMYPFNKISEGLLRFRDLLDFEIVSIIDFVNHVGCDSGVAMNCDPNGILVMDDLQKAFEGVDTLVLNDGGAPIIHFAKAFAELNMKEKWKEVVATASKLGVKIVSIHEITDSELVPWMKENKIEMITYSKTKEQFQEIIRNDKKTSDVIAKKVGIYGTRSCIGKYTAQMYLYRTLLKNGKKTSALITEPTAPLYHQYDVDPIRFLAVIKDPIQYNQYIKSLVHSCENNGSEYIIMAGQQGLAYNGVDNIYGNLIRLSNVIEYHPDYILLIVGYDDDDAIQNCMDLIRIYLGSKPFAFLVPDRVEAGYGNYETKTQEEMEARMQDLRSKFPISHVLPVKEVASLIPCL